MDLLADATEKLRALAIPILGCVVHRAYQPPARKYYYGYANRTPPQQQPSSESESVVESQAAPTTAG
jgi:hypothetical protein